MLPSALQVPLPPWVGPLALLGALACGVRPPEDSAPDGPPEVGWSLEGEDFWVPRGVLIEAILGDGSHEQQRLATDHPDPCPALQEILPPLSQSSSEFQAEHDGWNGAEEARAYCYAYHDRLGREASLADPWYEAARYSVVADVPEESAEEGPVPVGTSRLEVTLYARDTPGSPYGFNLDALDCSTTPYKNFLEFEDAAVWIGVAGTANRAQTAEGERWTLDGVDVSRSAGQPLPLRGELVFETCAVEVPGQLVLPRFK